MRTGRDRLRPCAAQGERLIARPADFPTPSLQPAPRLIWSPERLDRLGAAQTAAVFGAVRLGVLGAAAEAAILAFSLTRIGAVGGLLALSWALAVGACAIAHLTLLFAYRRSRSADSDWRRWARWFTAICCVEGIIWGLMPVAVGTGNGFESEMLALVGLAGVAAGAIPAFSPSLPAFAAFFFPATIPYTVWSALEQNPLHQATTALMLLFVVAIFALGANTGRSFRQLVGLRMETAELAEDLRRQKDIAEAASLAKSSFLAAASHDLRQPVHALGLFAGALRATAIPPEARRLVEQIEASTSAMDELFTALLDISRLDAGVVEVRRRPFALDPFLARLCRDHEDEAREKGVKLRLHRCRAVAFSDPALMERIVRNLIANAVRYTEAGRVVVGCRIRGNFVAIQVWDTGPGIPADQQDRVFQEYYQLGNAERDRTKGLGLGLAIVRRLVQLLGARLTLKSDVGRGSCFEVVVPISERSEAVEEAPESPSRALVVIIDDELAIRDGMVTLLTGWGHEVVAAASGDEAMALLESRPTRPDLIISDYRLRAGETGIGVVERLRSEYNEPIPAMLITGDTGPDRLTEARQSGLLLLHKPVSNSRLRAAMSNLMRAAAAARAPAPVD